MIAQKVPKEGIFGHDKLGYFGGVSMGIILKLVERSPINGHHYKNGIYAYLMTIPRYGIGWDNKSVTS